MDVRQHEQVEVAQAVESVSILWHASLGNISATKMKAVSQACNGVPSYENFCDSSICAGCAE